MTVTDRTGRTVAQSAPQSYGRFADRTASPDIQLDLASFDTDLASVIPGGQFSLIWEPWRGDFGNTDEWHIDKIDVKLYFAGGGFNTHTIFPPSPIILT